MKINPKKIDLLVVVVIIILSTFLILKFDLKFLITGVLYLFAPSLYLLLRRTWDLKNILIASSASIIPGFIFSFLHTINGSWYIPQGQLIIPYRFFGVLPVDEIIWYFLFTFGITTFYEHFIEKEATKIVSKKFKYAFFVSSIVLAGVLLLYLIIPNILEIKYSYLFFSLIFIIPLLYLITKKPFFINKFSKIAVFFFFVFFVCELVAVKTGQWIFPGEYIGMVHFFGLSFPFEEFFFWIIISSMGFLT
jgi:hypothetical protein